MFFLLFFFILLPGIFADCPVGTLEYPFVPPSKCYSFMATKATFSSAEASCEKTGGTLTSIHDAFTNTFIKEEASLIFRDSATYDFWIGASKPNNGDWSWTDKSPFDFTDWQNSGTNNSLNYGSMIILNGMWTTADSKSEKPFVCSINSNTSSPSTTTTPKPLTNCPEDWYYFGDTNSCYFATDLFTWEKAEEYCANFGGHLASLHSSAERDFALSVYRGSLWIGLYTNESSITKHTTWKWTDGSQVNFLPWYYPYFTSVIPSCIQLTGMSQYPIFINENCTDKFYGLCKKPAATSPPPTSPIPTTLQTDVSCLSGWQYFEKTNSCYIRGQYSHWPEAEQYCIYLDAHLPSIHSQEELNVVLSINGYGWVGLYSENNAISWKWIDETPFDYRNWGVGNPVRGGNPCVNIADGGYRNDVNCFTMDWSVCQRAAFKKVI